VSLDQSVRREPDEFRQESVEALGGFDELDAHRQMLPFHSASVLVMNPMVLAEARIGPNQGRTGNTLLQEEQEDVPVKKIRAGTGVLVEMDRDLLRRSKREHELSGCTARRARTVPELRGLPPDCDGGPKSLHRWPRRSDRDDRP
jgi:hypothetical protein